MHRSNNRVTAEATLIAVDLETARARARAHSAIYGVAELWSCEFKAEAPS